MKKVLPTLACLVLVGCQSAPPPVPAAFATSPRQASADAAAFLKTLKEMPAGDRAAYVQSHPEGAQAVATFRRGVLQPELDQLLNEQPAN